MPIAEPSFLEQLNAFLDVASGWVWGLPLIILLVGTGLYLTIRLRFVQFTQLGPALWLALVQRREPGDEPGDITHFQALMTALSATVGTGNIVGVALAIFSGGPGALFWMWITGLVGMATKYAEAVLAVEYRTTDENGRMAGGPMYYLSRGLGGLGLPVIGKILAFAFAIFATVASFGIGNMTQSNSVAEALQSSFGVPQLATGLALFVMSALVILGGIRSIAKVTQFVVPFMILAYTAAGLVILAANISALPGAFALIFESAFSPAAAAGGFAGALVKDAIRMGVSRGIFSNESGLGSSPIAAAAAQTKHPVSQALVSMTQTFIDTLVVCTITGLILIVTGAWQSGLKGADMTVFAFTEGLDAWTFAGAGGKIVAIALAFFAYSTILGWSYYGERAAVYLVGAAVSIPFRIIFIVLVLVGAVAKIDTVWLLSDVFNGLMALPNLVGLLLLAGVAAKITREYRRGD